MKKRFIILSILFIPCLTAFSRISIDECYAKARANYPLIRQYGLIETSRDYSLSNASKGYLPQISFSAGVSYRSDVTKLPVDFSQLGIPGANIPALSRDQYHASVDIHQAIWDGGAAKSRKEGIRTSSEIEKQSLEVELYSIRERVNQVFFGILLFDAQLEQNRLYQEELQRNFDKVSSWVRNGIANRADLDAVKVEQLRAVQNESRLIHTRKAYLDILSALTGEELDSDVQLVKPEAFSEIATPVQRPELGLFNARIENMEAQNRAIKAGTTPRLGVFLTGGYGKPGLNMLENDFSAYYIAGVNLSWNFGNLYTNKNDKQQIQNSIAAVQTQQETFLFNTNLDVSRKQSEINKYLDLLKYDDGIISLRTSVKQSSETKMANGTLSGIDLMRDINAEEMAKQDKILHEIELLHAVYNLKFVTN
jgi:outer membrane protein TolC